MIGLDTNVIIRYLVQDEPEQSKKANQFIDKCVHAGKTLWICQLTLCEVFWVLERCYKLSKEELVSVLSALIYTRQIQIEHFDIAVEALRDFQRNPKVDFSDCLIGRQNAHHECVHTMTFDRNAAKLLPHTFKIL